jgi:hypothetical protein
MRQFDVQSGTLPRELTAIHCSMLDSRNVTARQAIRFIERHGVILESGQGPAPSLVTEVLGGRIRGSWWAHPRAKEFFWLTRAIRDSPQVLVCRLIGGKITYVHRRLWPALTRLSSDIGRERLAKIQEVHTPSGKHEVEETPFPKWVPADVIAAARRVDRADAVRQLGPYAAPTVVTASVSRQRRRAGQAPARKNRPDRKARRG